VVYTRRGPDDPELSPLLKGRNHLHPAVHRVQNAVCETPSASWSLPRMADVAYVTPRHLTRLFSSHVGVTPRAYVEGVRTALAQQALAQGATTQRALDVAGIGSTRQWRRVRARVRRQA
jgi:transcriptional regulator GlxA family with amidase domain